MKEFSHDPFMLGPFPTEHYRVCAEAFPRCAKALLAEGAIALKSFQQFADGGVIAGRKKRQAAFLRPKNKPDGETGPAFEIVLPKTPNPQAGMKMWSSKTVANGIDRARDFAPSRFR